MSPGRLGPVTAVTVDLDDTLFPQSSWLAGAWASVAARAAQAGVPQAELLAALHAVAAEGSDRGHIIDRALAAVGVPAGEVPRLLPGLVAAFTGHAPAWLPAYDGALAALAQLRARVPVAIVTDGAAAGQLAKVRALGLSGGVDAVVVSDALGGRALRKPHPAAFHRALQLLDAAPGTTVHIGDRPAKDMAGAAAAGLRSVRVRTGEYAADDGRGSAAPLRTFRTLQQAVAWLCPALVPQPGRPAEAARLVGRS